jgi:hypothetical protein
VGPRGILPSDVTCRSSLPGSQGGGEGRRPKSVRSQRFCQGPRFSYNSYMSRPTTLERAFEMARSGDFASVREIRDALKAEGFDALQMHGTSLERQIRQLCSDARKNTAEG